jgi:hypothetical protein
MMGFHFETRTRAGLRASKVDPERYAPTSSGRCCTSRPSSPRRGPAVHGWTDFEFFLREWGEKAERCRDEHSLVLRLR